MNNLEKNLYIKHELRFDKNGNFIKVYPSISEAKRQTKICHISSVATGKRKTAGGYIWRFC